MTVGCVVAVTSSLTFGPRRYC